MAKTLQQEFYRFSRHCMYIRRLLRETKQSLQEISKSDYFNEVQLSSIQQFQQEEEKAILEVVTQPVGLVILGQNCWAKARVANELLDQPLLPVIPPPTPSTPTGDPTSPSAATAANWRMVRFKYGNQTQVSLSLPNSYILVQPLAAYDHPWHTVPLADLELKKEEEDPALLNAVLDINIRHSLLRDDVQLIVSPSNTAFDLMFSTCTEGLNYILIYAIGSDTLSPEEITELLELRKKVPKSPVFFVLAKPQPISDLTESEQHAALASNRPHRAGEPPPPPPPLQPACFSLPEQSLLQDYPALRPKRSDSADSSTGAQDKHQLPTPTLYQQLVGLGFLTLHRSDRDPLLPAAMKKVRRRSLPLEVESELVEHFQNFKRVNEFIQRIFKQLLVHVLSLLNDLHTKCLRMFIMSAFDMTWDMMITPRKLEYARQREAELFETLMCIANCKQDEIRQLIVSTILGMKDSLLEKAENYAFQGVQLPENGEPPSTRDIQICTTEIQDLVLSAVNSRVAGRLIGSVDYLRESYIGTLERCLDSLEKNCKEGHDSFHASSALKQILNAAYQVEMTVKTSSTFLRALLEKMKQLVQSLPWKTPPVIDGEWKRRVASDMLASLSESRLARSICSQFRERLRYSHEQFLASMRHLESLHSGRLERTEEMRLKVRKVHAPKIARFALESTSLRDYILFGMPQLGREIGRGHYGVVYSCDSWAGYSPCAIKSVVPTDEKNWNDLAMEFFYTRSIPEHERIVKIRGSVIDTSYANGNSSAVLLIMEKLQRDLYCAIKFGLDWISRLQVAIDVVQGIRYLHSQGLVHRDIKLKNVLLDKRNRAKLTDLGFCKPEAMMSGSIVGTPIHMAPELFSGRYDNSVDVYAFGILFWCICAGHVRLPYVFEQCQSKDQLWHSVKRGARPERLPQFDDECWKLMEECWSADPSSRPLLGDVEPRLEAIKSYYQSHPPPSPLGMQVLEREVAVLSSSPYIDVDVFPS